MRTRQKLSKCDRNMNINEILIDFVNQIKIEIWRLPVAPVIDLQPGEDGAAGEEGAGQPGEAGQVGGQELPHRVLINEEFW